MILSLWILGLPISLGNRITIDVSQRASGFSLSSAIDVMLWWICHILSLKSSFPLLYWVPSGANKL